MVNPTCLQMEALKYLYPGLSLKEYSLCGLTSVKGLELGDTGGGGGGGGGGRRVEGEEEM